MLFTRKCGLTDTAIDTRLSHCTEPTYMSYMSDLDEIDSNNCNILYIIIIFLDFRVLNLLQLHTFGSKLKVKCLYDWLAKNCISGNMYSNDDLDNELSILIRYF